MMLKKILLGMVIGFAPMGFLYGQSTHIEEQTVVPPSPQAASLFKYVDSPVSYFTGLPNISIPLHEISEGAISLPISLSYHAGGIKVTEEGGWVGLGWNLNAGGAITRVVKGKVDECIAEKIHYVYPDPDGGEYSELAMNNNLANCSYFNKNGELLDMETTFFGNKGNFDSEPDLYMYNFGGYSGKFFRSGGEYYDLSHNNIKFEIESSLAIKALAPNGFTYYFYTPEFSKSFPVSSACNETPIANTFLLSRIESPYNSANTGVDFSYKTFATLWNENPHYRVFEGISYENVSYIPQLPQLSEQYVKTLNPVGGNGQHRSYSFNMINLQYLDRIDFKNGYVKFDISPREDLYGFKLDYIRIYRTGETTPIKEFQFNYNYFIGNKANGGDYMELRPTAAGSYWADYPEEYRKKRLKLLSVTEKSGNAEGRKHSFEYNNTELPYKTSFAQDYWGYFNGQNAGIKTMIPDFSRYLYQLDLPVELRNWVGANREPNEDLMKAGMLKRIVYPTKGYTEFDFELNEYTNLNNQQGRKFTSKFIEAVDINRDKDNKYSAGVQEKPFEIKFDAAMVDISVYLFCESSNNSKECESGTLNWACKDEVDDANSSIYAYIAKWNSGAQEWVKLSINDVWAKHREKIRDCSKGGMHSYSKLLQPGRYKLVANLPDKMGGVDNPGAKGHKLASISVKYSSSSEWSNDAKTGGGPRVSKITNFDPVENKSVDRVFSYKGGIMTRFPIFYWNTIVYRYATLESGSTIDHYYDTYYLYSSPNVPYSFNANGSLVGYEKVTETTSGNGKVEYEYKVREDLLDYRFARNLLPAGIDGRQYLPGVPSTGFLDNGNLLSTKYFREGASTPLKEIQNKYKILKPGMVWNFKFLNNNPEVRFDVGFCGPISTCFYPVKYGKMVLSESVEKTVDDNGIPVSQKTEYMYDNDDHLQLTRKIDFNSDNSKQVTQILYPQDYTNTIGFIGRMKDKNLIAKPIEIISYSTNETGGNIKILGGKITTYHDEGSKAGLPDKEWLLEASQAIPLSEFRFSNQASVNTLPHTEAPNDFDIKNIAAQYPVTEKINYSFNGFGNVQAVKQPNNATTAYIWGYNNTLPIAEVQNAEASNVFHTSFEEDGNKTGGDSKTGMKSLFTGASGYSRTIGGLSIGSYTLSYWQKGSTRWILKSRIEKVTSSTHSITFPANIQIDEVRFHPVDAMMSTFTYDPFIGKTSEMDVNGVLVKYEYDALGRLENIKDEQGNILNHYKYNYMD